MPVADRIRAATALLTGRTPWRVEVANNPDVAIANSPDVVVANSPTVQLPGAPTDLSPQQLGVVAVHLWATFPLWVRRRKTAFEFLDEASVSQRQSIDFALRPEHFPPGAVPIEDQVIFVPLNVARKEPLTGSSVLDEDRRALSLLNTAENGAVATAGLSALVDGLTGPEPRPARMRRI